ncbi:MAG: hypothetical protein IJN17_00515 [Clostridia bacterium]|nr:hypothetical protein [Clostridia bacterium]
MNYLQYLLAAMATAPSKEVETSLEVGKDLVEELGEATETAAELGFEPSRFVDMLSYMGIGMFIIFVLIGVIILVTVLTNKIFSGNQG